MLIDSHCHVNFNAYNKDDREIIDRSLAEDIWLINIGSEYETSRRSIGIAENYQQGVYAVVGLHPIHVTGDVTESVITNGQTQEVTTRREEFDYNKYKELAKSSKKVVGLGEVGLDYFYFDRNEADAKAKKNLQKEYFNQFINLASELNLPLVVHCRGHKDNPYEVYDDILEIIQGSDKKIRGVIHCFGGNSSQAQKFINLGFYIGFTGIITFKKKAEELQQIAKEIPLEKILIETDAPYLAPEPHRGQRNEPSYVKFVAQKIAQLKGLNLEEVANTTTANARNLFNI
ncbi:MAG: TatD family hydrolase [Candidatus Buchananbacteria bacterium]|nr:TatD family hydrolase [Candidatus Buchananbacteria bacterium]